MNAPVWPRHARVTTRSGITLDLLRPRRQDINVDDIALGLSRRARWSGQTEQFLSVAEHSIAVAGRAEQLAAEDGCSHAMQSAAALVGLLHDAAEAYLPHVPSPLKVHMVVMEAEGPVSFADVERRLLRAIYAQVGLGLQVVRAVSGYVGQADREVLRLEADAEMHGTKGWTSPPPRPRAFLWTPMGWPPEVAQLQWQAHFDEAIGLFSIRRGKECFVVRGGRA